MMFFTDGLSTLLGWQSRDVEDEIHVLDPLALWRLLSAFATVRVTRMTGLRAAGKGKKTKRITSTAQFHLASFNCVPSDVVVAREIRRIWFPRTCSCRTGWGLRVPRSTGCSRIFGSARSSRHSYALSRPGKLKMMSSSTPIVLFTYQAARVVLNYGTMVLSLIHI